MAGLAQAALKVWEATAKKAENPAEKFRQGQTLEWLVRHQTDPLLLYVFAEIWESVRRRIPHQQYTKFFRLQIQHSWGHFESDIGKKKIFCDAARLLCHEPVASELRLQISCLYVDISVGRTSRRSHRSAYNQLPGLKSGKHRSCQCPPLRVEFEALDKTALLFYISRAVKQKTKAFHIKIDSKSALPTYEQIKQALKMAIFSGQLEEGDRLSSLREIALKLNVNPNTIIKVYYQLEMEGFIYSRPGAGYYVKLDPSKIKLGRQELFQNITEGYVSKALQLGYSIEDIIDEISKKENTDD